MYDLKKVKYWPQREQWNQASDSVVDLFVDPSSW